MGDHPSESEKMGMSEKTPWSLGFLAFSDGGLVGSQVLKEVKLHDVP